MLELAKLSKLTGLPAIGVPSKVIGEFHDVLC